MRRRNNALQIIAAILFILILIAGIYVWLIYKKNTAPKSESVTIYYYEPISMELIPQKVSAELPENPVLKVEKIVNLLKTPRASSGLFPVLNKDATVNSVRFNNGICTVDLNEKATEIKPLTVRMEAITVYGLVNTLTEINGITAVQITIDGRKRKYFNHYIEVDEPLTHLSTALPTGKTVALYFATPDFSHLAVEEREVVNTQNPVTLGKEILRELFYGSIDGLSSTFPKDTKLNDFYIKSGGIGVVDISSSILKHPLGSGGEQLRVMSLVNTLTDLPDISAVRILIDGKPVNTLYGSVDTSNPIPRFLGITQDNDVVIPYYTLKIGGKTFFCPFVKTIEGKDRITELFNLLKVPDNGFGTYISANTKLSSFSQNKNSGILTLNITTGNTSEKDVENIAKELVLSYKEFPDINKVKVKINGVLINVFQ